MTTSMVLEFGESDALGHEHGGVPAHGAAPRRHLPGTEPRAPRRTAPVPRSARELAADAALVLGRAMADAEPRERFALAHLAALRGAAAVLATRARPRRQAHGNAWELLTRIAPELAEWASFFAASARRRQAIVAGVGIVVPSREADDMVRAAAEFLGLVELTLSHGRSRAGGR
jgi:hypothetical protein